jgi:hypothetical protein
MIVASDSRPMIQGAFRLPFAAQKRTVRRAGVAKHDVIVSRTGVAPDPGDC